MAGERTGTAGPLGGATGRLVLSHRDDVLRVLEQYGVTHAQVFGSVARGDDIEGSDVDLLVELPKGTGLLTIARIEQRLETILGVRVDLTSDRGLKDVVRRRIAHDLVEL